MNRFTCLFSVISRGANETFLLGALRTVRLSLPLLSVVPFTEHCFGQSATFGWAITASAQETPNGASGSVRAQGFLNGIVASSQRDEKQFTATAEGTCSVPYNVSASAIPTSSGGGYWGSALVWVSESSPGGGSRTVASKRVSPATPTTVSATGTLSVPVHAGNTYTIGAQAYYPASASGTYSAGYNSHSITGQCNGFSTIQRIEGVQDAGSYSINWNNSLGGSKTLTAFLLSPADPAPRFRLWAEPGYTQTGQIKGEFRNERPVVALILPAQGQLQDSNTPAFIFNYFDQEGDAQRSFQLQIARDALFNTVVHDSLEVSNSSAAYDLPLTNSLSAGTYYWRVRAADIYTTAGQYGSWSNTRTFITPDPDADQDGMDDSWEIANFGSVNAAQAASDFDADGSTDLNEYRFGTNPRNSVSNTGLSFNGAAPSPSGDGLQITLSWNSVAGKRYDLERSADLANWTKVVENIEATPPYNSATDIAERQGYYRLVLSGSR